MSNGETAGSADHVPAGGAVSGDSYLTHGRGLKSWLLTLDHKRIGVLYLISIVGAFALARSRGPDRRPKGAELRQILLALGAHVRHVAGDIAVVANKPSVVFASLLQVGVVDLGTHRLSARRAQRPDEETLGYPLAGVCFLCLGTPTERTGRNQVIEG